ncbi:MAG TPA: peptidoglycan-binding domain-containing protein [Solirubrobacter sp.]
MTLRSGRFAGEPRLEACLSGAATLERGAVGAAVAKVQQALMELGFSLREFGPDGVFGVETSDAVAAFDGEPVVGARTMAALDERFAADPLPEPREPVDLPRVDPASAVQAAHLALAEAEAGAHFLAGAAGAVGADLLAPGHTDPVAPAVFAAQAAHRVCCGRFNARNGGIAGGRPADPTDTDLIVYLARLASLPVEAWTPFFGFFSPRCGDGRLVWGEDCRSKRHFDGPGLVSWCFAQAAAIGSDAAAWVSVPLTDPPRTGDVVIRAMAGQFTHVGFLLDDPPRVVLAEHPSVGVVVRRFTPAGWTLRRRLS